MAMMSEKESKPFFFGKKNQKLLSRLTRRSGHDRDCEVKSFWFFFSNKNCLPSLLPTPGQAGDKATYVQ